MSPNDDYSGEPGGPIAYMASNGVAANLLMFALLGAGLVSLTGLEREAWPSVPFNHVEVSMAYPGATPDEVEESIVVKIEVESGTDMRQAIDDIESAVVRLSDIAEVHDEFQDIDLIIRHQNQPAAFVEVYRVEGEQVMDVATAVHEHIAEVIIPSLPDGVVAAIRGARRIKVPLTFAVLTSIAGAIFADDDPDKDDLEENFSDPGRFDIDRFAPPREEHKKTGAYVPFGLGTHRCLGSRLVELQMAINLLLIAHYFNISVLPSDYEIGFNPFPTAAPNKKLKFRIDKRRNGF